MPGEGKAKIPAKKNHAIAAVEKKTFGKNFLKIKITKRRKKERKREEEKARQAAGRKATSL